MNSEAQESVNYATVTIGIVGCFIIARTCKGLWGYTFPMGAMQAENAAREGMKLVRGQVAVLIGLN